MEEERNFKLKGFCERGWKQGNSCWTYPKKGEKKGGRQEEHGSSMKPKAFQTIRKRKGPRHQSKENGKEGHESGGRKQLHCGGGIRGLERLRQFG